MKAFEHTVDGNVNNNCAQYCCFASDIRYSVPAYKSTVSVGSGLCAHSTCNHKETKRLLFAFGVLLASAYERKLAFRKRFILFQCKQMIVEPTQLLTTINLFRVQTVLLGLIYWHKPFHNCESILGIWRG